MRTVVLLLRIDTVYGGAERRLGRILNEVAKSNKFKCYIYMTGAKRYVEYYISEEKLGNINYRYFNNDLSCIRQIKIDDIDTLWFFNLNHLGFKLIMIPHNYKVIVTIANAYLSRFYFAHYKQKLVFGIITRMATIVDCLYPASEEKFKKRKYTNYRITPCPFTDLKKFYPGKKERVIIFASRLVKGKNVFKSIEALKIIEYEIIKFGFKMYIYGEGELKGEAVRLANELNMNHYLTIGEYIDLSTVLPYSSVFLSLQELTNYPSQVLLESIACGNYIVAIDNEDTNKIVKDDFGCLVKNEVESISLGILNAIHIMTSEQMHDVVIKARKFAEEKFDVRKSVEYFSEILY